MTSRLFDHKAACRRLFASLLAMLCSVHALPSDRTDDESDRILSALAQDYEGDLGKALGGPSAGSREHRIFRGGVRRGSAGCFTRPTERAERGFREGRFTAWDEVKRHNNL